VLLTRAPRRGTLIVALIVYVFGLFGWLDLLPALAPFASPALAFAGGLLILGTLLRDL
jgi:hypothetical protein